MANDSSDTGQADNDLAAHQTGFALVPCWIAPLGWKAITTYYALASVARGERNDRKCRAKHRTVADLAGVSVSTIREGIALLAEAGAVRIEERYSDRDGARLCNVYHLAIDPPCAVATGGTPAVATGAPPATQQAVVVPEVVGPEVPPSGGTPRDRPVRPEVTELCALLATHVGALTGVTPVVSKAWERDMRLTLEAKRGVDGPPWTADQVRYVIGWLGKEGERSQFWSMNVRCPAKLRAKMQRLVDEIKHERDARPTGNGNGRRVQTHADLAAMADRLMAS